MKNLKAFGIAVILFIFFVWLVLIATTKIVIPQKLDIGKSITTPNVVELELNEAKQKLRDAGFTFQDSLAIEWVTSPLYPDKTVITQTPVANKIVKNTNRIKLEVSTGGKQVVIPLVLEDNAINASSKIKQLGLEVIFVKKNYGIFDQNTVVKVEPEVGSKVLKGSTVILYIESEYEDEELKNDIIDKELSEDNELDTISSEVDPKNEPDIEDLSLEEILKNN